MKITHGGMVFIAFRQAISPDGRQPPSAPKKSAPDALLLALQKFNATPAAWRIKIRNILLQNACNMKYARHTYLALLINIAKFGYDILMTDQFDDRERFFIVTAGRTGSSLLSSILAEAGAEFGMSADQSWDESEGGSFEHPLVVRAARHFRSSHDSSLRPPAGLSRWPWAFARHLGKCRLRQALARARYVKAVNLDLTVQAAFKLGYFPRIIVNYRRFTAHAISLSQMFAHRGIEVLAADYLRTYRNALMQLHLYGGCVVGYDELTSPLDDGWITALASVTGFPAATLASARQPRIRPATTPKRALPPLGAETEGVFASLQSLSGCVIPPSAQALRNWRARQLGA